MKNQSYYRLPDNYSCNFAVTDRCLIVNCAGISVLPEPFQTRNPNGRQDEYLMYLYRGRLDVEAAGHSLTLRAGDLMLYPVGQAYSYRNAGEEEVIYFWIHFSGYAAENILKEAGIRVGEVYHPGKSEELVSCFEQLFQLFYLRKHFFELEAAAHLLIILSKTARRILRQSDAEIRSSAAKIRQSLDYLYRNYAEPVHLRELAELEHLSPSRYSAVFRQCMGMSPQNFLIMLRINNAADLICRTDLTVKQVAQAVGYEDPFYFSNLFKRKMGLSPIQYRQAQEHLE